MEAKLLVRQRVEVRETAFAELVVWELPRPLPGSEHMFKYHLAYVSSGVCVLRYDNEAGKGDHRHCGHVETPYGFTSPAQLMADFFEDIQRYNHDHADD
jgi:Family of unknown function (DUF6516)